MIFILSLAFKLEIYLKMSDYFRLVRLSVGASAQQAKKI